MGGRKLALGLVRILRRLSIAGVKRRAGLRVNSIAMEFYGKLSASEMIAELKRVARGMSFDRLPVLDDRVARKEARDFIRDIRFWTEVSSEN